MRSIEAVQLLAGSGCDLFLCHNCRHDYVERFRFSIVIPKNGQKCEICRRTWVLDRVSIGTWKHKNNIDRLTSYVIDEARREHGCGKQLYAVIVRYREPDGTGEDVG